MKGFLIALVLFFHLTCPLFAGDAEGPASVGKKIILDSSSKGKRIEARIGDEIQIELKATGGTGYAWYLDKPKDEFFELMGEERKTSGVEGKDAVGTPVTSIWRLKARKAGRSIIGMSYYRPWEGKDKALDRFEVTVDIIP